MTTLTRLDAIREVGHAFGARCGEFCEPGCTCIAECRTVLHTLGVTPSEIRLAFDPSIRVV